MIQAGQVLDKRRGESKIALLSRCGKFGVTISWYAKNRGKISNRELFFRAPMTSRHRTCRVNKYYFFGE
jgi:hypothetical protein